MQSLGNYILSGPKTPKVSVCCSFGFVWQSLVVIQSSHEKRDPKPGGKVGSQVGARVAASPNWRAVDTRHPFICL